jgi:hypothetical protein
MTTSSLKTQIKQLQDKFQPQIDKVNVEGRNFLKNMGATTIEGKSLSEIFAEIREKNPSVKSFLYNLDAATYDLRKKIEWNANMIPAFAKFEAEKKFERKVKPFLDSYLEKAEGYIESAESGVKDLADKATKFSEEFKAKVTK